MGLIKQMMRGIHVGNRYIYHYNCQSRGCLAGWSGIAQLTFRIASQDDLNKLRKILSDTYDEDVVCITSLSYLGRERE